MVSSRVDGYPEELFQGDHSLQDQLEAFLAHFLISQFVHAAISYLKKLE